MYTYVWCISSKNTIIVYMQTGNFISNPIYLYGYYRNRSNIQLDIEIYATETPAKLWRKYMPSQLAFKYSQ